MKILKKLKNITTLYWDFEEGEITPDNPKNDYSWKKLKKDYDVIRIGTVFEVYKYNEYMEDNNQENINKIVCKYCHGYIIFDTMQDILDSQLFKEKND